MRRGAFEPPALCWAAGTPPAVCTRQKAERLGPVWDRRLVRVLRLLRFAQASAEMRALGECVSRVLPALRLILFFLSL